MSLVKTLAKVAAGVVVANSVKGMLGGGGTGRARQAPAGGGLEDILGQVLGGGTGGGRSAGRGGSLEDVLGQVLGGGALGGSRGGGGLQDILGQVLAGGAGGMGGARGGMGGMLDELSRMSRPSGAGPVGGAMAGAAAGTVVGATAAQGGFGDLLNQSLERFGEPDRAPTRQEEALAAVLLRAMIQAAKADGRIDDAEKQRLLGRLGDVSQDEMAFVEAELKRPVDAAALAREVPAGAEQQVYMVSAMAIDLDEQSEARHLDALARALRLDPATVNAIHDRLGAPHIYR